ncbi:MAG: glycoside hydrolase family 20 zincin-like fold domain-containing protein, partial [Alistipes sp.]|nr:glycoside hydrolase family 20 zincin-like fold domain-containing protein [Alistipes sp.]
MKSTLLAVIALFAITFSASAVAIVPQPLSITKHENNFTINTSTTIYCEVEAFAPIAKYAQEYLAVGISAKTPQSNYIALVLDKSLAEEEYRLSVSRESVRIVAGGYGGAFNGVQTLFQLLPSEVYTKKMSLPAEV